MADIPITGYPSNYRTPAWAVELNFGAGQTITGNATKKILLCMPKLASGTWVAGTLYSDVRNVADVETGAGAGSPMHRAFRIINKVNPNAAVDCLPFAATSGGSPAKANLDITWTTNPTGNGESILKVQDEVFRYAFDSDDTVTTIATAHAAQVNAATHLACTATNASGVLTLTAKLDGSSQGDGTIGVIRVGCSVTGGVGVSVATENSNQLSALGLGTGTSGADGTTTESANMAAALATVKNRYEYTTISGWEATAVAALTTHIASAALPKSARRGHGIVGFSGVRTAAATRAIAQNNERIELICQQRSWHDPAELAGWLAAVRQKRRSVGLAAFDYYRDPIYQLKPAPAQADWPSEDDLNDSISDGVTEIMSNETTSYIGMLVSTRSKDSTGTYDEFKASEPHRVDIMDDFGDACVEAFRGNYRNAILLPDKLLSDGSVDMNQDLPAGAITPHIARSVIVNEAERLEERGWLINLAESIESLRVQLDPDNTGRIESGGDFRTCNIAHQVTMRFQEITPG